MSRRTDGGRGRTRPNSRPWVTRRFAWIVAAVVCGCVSRENGADTPGAEGGDVSAQPPPEHRDRDTTTPPPLVVRFAPAAGAAGVPAEISAFCQPAEPTVSSRPVRVDTAQFARAPRALMRYDIESYLNTPLRCVVRSQEDWDTIRPLTAIRPDRYFPHAPAVDFGSEMLIVAGAGARPSFFYNIRVEGTWTRGDTLVVAVGTIPPVGETALDMGTNPAVVVKVPKVAGPVFFVER